MKKFLFFLSFLTLVSCSFEGDAVGNSGDGEFTGRLIKQTKSNVIVLDKLQFKVENEIQLTSDNIYMAPKFSPDNKKIAFSSDKYRGLWVMDLEKNMTMQLSDRNSVGYMFAWSPDSSYIAGREVAIDSDFNHLFKLITVDITTGKEYELTDFSSNIYPPSWRTGLTSLNSETKKLFNFNLKKTITLEDINRDPFSAVTSDNHVWLVENISGKKRVISPAGGHSGVLSPDMKKISYLLGNNIMVYDIVTETNLSLGEGSHPSWSPCSRYILYAITEDDHHDITASDLFVKSADGSAYQKLTSTRERVELFPSWSGDGTKIAYSDNRSGNIFLLHITQQ